MNKQQCVITVIVGLATGLAIVLAAAASTLSLFVFFALLSTGGILGVVANSPGSPLLGFFDPARGPLVEYRRPGRRERLEPTVKLEVSELLAAIEALIDERLANAGWEETREASLLPTRVSAGLEEEIAASRVRAAGVESLDSVTILQSAMEHFEKRRSDEILSLLAKEPERFAALETSTGMHARHLSLRLRELEHQGLIKREVETSGALSVTYALTGQGAALLPLIEALKGWIACRETALKEQKQSSSAGSVTQSEESAGKKS